MMKINVCPCTLAEGFETYSPAARKMLFDGKAVSHLFHGTDPASDSAESQEAFKMVGRISLSGVQPKLSAIVEEDRLRYVKPDEQGIFILKPVSMAYHLLNRHFCVANEHLTMQLAGQVYGIETAANALCFFEEGGMAYITRRFDIDRNGGKLPQEDFAALLGFTSAQGGSDFKYCNSSYEECAQVIRRYVKAAPIDLLRFFRVILFNFITLNDDAHLKNFSLLKQKGEYRLSPAYDLINTSLHLVQSRIFALDKGLFREGMQLSDVHQVGKDDFREFGIRIGLPEKVVKREIERFGKYYPLTDELISHSFLSDELKKTYQLAMKYRIAMLSM